MDPVTTLIVKHVAQKAQQKAMRIALSVIPFVLITALLFLVFMLGGAGQQAASIEEEMNCDQGGAGDGSIPVAAITKGSKNATAEQRQNAATIIAVGKSMNVPARGWVIAIATASQESGLRNLNYGDRDSLGLFQQRPSAGWGTPQQIRDPQYAARKFYEHLVKIRGWERMPLTVAAQKVQVSAFPDAYADDEPLAKALVSELSGEVELSGAMSSSSGTSAEQGAQLPIGESPYNLGAVKPQAKALANYLGPKFGIKTVGGYRASARDPNGHPSGLALDFMTSDKAQGDRLAEYAKQNASQLGVDYIIWRQRIWSTARSAEGWRGMADRGSPTENHFDHVHINVTKAGVGTIPTSQAMDQMGQSSCVSQAVVAGGGTVHAPLPEGTYRDLDNYGGRGGHWASTHTGNDLSAPCGTPVFAVTNGTVRIRTDQAWAGRHLVMVETGKGQLTTWYAHMSKVSVAAGTQVTAGQQIGEVGQEGNATGCHLHLEVHPKGGGYMEDQVDPHDWLKDNLGRNLGGSSVSLGGVPASAAMFARGDGDQGGSFTISTFNTLGASHTARGGEHPSMASGAARTTGAIQVLETYGVDVVGLQEFQREQRDAFVARAEGWQLWYWGHDTENAIAWRSSRFELVQTMRLNIPYFNGRSKAMPVVMLRDRQTNALMWMLNVHNPAETWFSKGNAGNRRVAVAREIRLAKRLAASGTPVYVTGDMNEKGRVGCAFTSAGIQAAAGRGVCQNPKLVGGYGIDWIFGTSGIAFGPYGVIPQKSVGQITDHPIVLSQTQVTG